MPAAMLPEADKIDDQQRQDGTELDQHHEGLAEIIVIETEETLHQQQMAGRGHRQELGQPSTTPRTKALKRSKTLQAPRRETRTAAAAVERGSSDTSAVSTKAVGRTAFHASLTPEQRARGEHCTACSATPLSIWSADPTMTAVCGRRSPRGSPAHALKPHADAVSSSVLSPFPFRAAGARRARDFGRAVEERGVGAPRGVPCPQPGLHHAGAGGGRSARGSRRGIIAEYLDETSGAELGDLRLLPLESRARVEVRRLMSWFNDKFFAEVSGPLTMERLYKRHMPVSAGGGSPETEVLRAARHNVRYHLAYIGWLVRTRDWLAGQPHELCRSCRRRAFVGDRLSGRRAMERRRDRKDLVRAGQVATVVPSDADRDAGRHTAVADLRRSRLLSDPAA